MYLKASKRGFRKEKYESKFIVVTSTVMVIHCCIWFEPKNQLWEAFKGGGGG